VNRHERQDRSLEPRQAFYAGLRKRRELTHDSQIYRAYLRAEEPLREQGGRVDRVVLDYELKLDYQRFLHERSRGRRIATENRTGSRRRSPRSARLSTRWTPLGVAQGETGMETS
jgi:hypothetical protein